jgi:hypothetical protein
LSKGKSRPWTKSTIFKIYDINRDINWLWNNLSASLQPRPITINQFIVLRELDTSKIGVSSPELQRLTNIAQPGLTRMRGTLEDYRMVSSSLVVLPMKGNFLKRRTVVWKITDLGRAAVISHTGVWEKVERALKRVKIDSDIKDISAVERGS